MIIGCNVNVRDLAEGWNHLYTFCCTDSLFGALKNNGL